MANLGEKLGLPSIDTMLQNPMSLYQPQTLQGDYSSLYSGTSTAGADAAGRFGKTALGEFFGFGDDADRVDYARNQQALNNEFVRQMIMLDEQNAFNMSEAQKDRDWQERMSNTAYQRAMADMKLAGLNPVLAFQQGGASTPSGSRASSMSPNSTSGTGYSRHSGNGAAIIGAITNLVSGALFTGAAINKSSKGGK